MIFMRVGEAAAEAAAAGGRSLTFRGDVAEAHGAGAEAHGAGAEAHGAATSCIPRAKVNLARGPKVLYGANSLSPIGENFSV